MAVSLTVHEIFSVRESRDLENWVKGCSRSLKMAPFAEPYREKGKWTKGKLKKGNGKSETEIE